MVHITTTKPQKNKLVCHFVFNFIHLPKAQKMVKQLHLTCVISDFRLEVAEKSALLGYYLASGGNLSPTFRDNLSVPFSVVKNPKSFLHFTSPESQPTHFLSTTVVY